jgi:hypothetical protein
MICATVDVAVPPPLVALLTVTSDVVTFTESAVPVPLTTTEQVFTSPAVPGVRQKMRSFELPEPTVREERTASVAEF